MSAGVATKLVGGDACHTRDSTERRCSDGVVRTVSPHVPHDTTNGGQQHEQDTDCRHRDDDDEYGVACLEHGSFDERRGPLDVVDLRGRKRAAQGRLPRASSEREARGVGRDVGRRHEPLRLHTSPRESV